MHHIPSSAPFLPNAPAVAPRRLRLAWLASCAVLATACGGGGGGSDSPPPPAPPATPSIASAIELNDNRQIGEATWANGDTSTGGQGATVAGIPCEAPNETFHVHAHLSILVDGQALAVPSSVGIVETATVDCHYRIHTHDLSGKIHIEGPVTFSATLGQLFAIWGRSLTRSDVAGITGKPVVAWIVEDGTVTRWDGELADIELTSHRHVALQIGTPVDELPYFTWTAD